MTVAELIDELQKCQPEWHVTFDGFELVGVRIGLNVTGESYVKLLMWEEGT